MTSFLLTSTRATITIAWTSAGRCRNDIATMFRMAVQSVFTDRNLVIFSISRLVTNGYFSSISGTCNLAEKITFYLSKRSDRKKTNCQNCGNHNFFAIHKLIKCLSNTKGIISQIDLSLYLIIAHSKKCRQPKTFLLNCSPTKIYPPYSVWVDFG